MTYEQYRAGFPNFSRSLGALRGCQWTSRRSCPSWQLPGNNSPSVSRRKAGPAARPTASTTGRTRRWLRVSKTRAPLTKCFELVGVMTWGNLGNNYLAIMKCRKQFTETTICFCRILKEMNSGFLKGLIGCNRELPGSMNKKFSSFQISTKITTRLSKEITLCQMYLFQIFKASTRRRVSFAILFDKLNAVIY